MKVPRMETRKHQRAHGRCTFEGPYAFAVLRRIPYTFAMLRRIP